MAVKRNRVEYNKNWYRTNKEKKRNSMFLQRYGITTEDYNKMFERQKGCCAICGKHQSQFDKALHVDHNHITGKVRGLLCSGCNLALGRFYTRQKLNRAIIYLEVYDA